MPILTSPAVSVRPGRARFGYESWQAAMKDAVRDPVELCRLLELPEEFALRTKAACSDFPLFAPRGYVARMVPGDPDDPLLRQILPVEAEMHDSPGFVTDPVGDAAATLSPGLLQKYPGRVLLVTTGACAIHCRYCFRRHFPYQQTPHTLASWQPALDAIAADRSIHEVILSGADPLTLVDESLAALADHLANIPHIRRLRVHSRLPIVIPERVTTELIEWLTGTRLVPVMVIHANHAQELAGDAVTAIETLVNAGIPVLNQAVLLAGVNDSLEAQLALSERLVDLRVMPYYLHQLDRVSGAVHFEVPAHQGELIVKQLQERLPGYAVPKFVMEIPGAKSKVPCEMVQQDE